MNKEKPVFTESELRLIREEAQRLDEIYFTSITMALNDLRKNISDDLAEVIRPMDDKYFTMLRELQGKCEKNEKKLNIHEGWLWGLTAAAAATIILIILFV